MKTKYTNVLRPLAELSPLLLQSVPQPPPLPPPHLDSPVTVHCLGQIAELSLVQIRPDTVL